MTKADLETENDELVDALEAVRRRLQQALALVEGALAENPDAETDDEEE